MRLQDIHIRDPFILAEDGVYYLYGTRCSDPIAPGAISFFGSGLDVYTSTDLIEWSAPQECFTRPADFWADRDFWAPEVHRWRGGYYMLVSLKAPGRCRGTQALRAESPLGPFVPLGDGPLTPRDWECLDGTLYIEQDGSPWLVFCHEWVQIGNGAVCALPLRPDLAAPAGEPVVLFHAADPDWVRAVDGRDGYVTDGPFLRRAADGRLWMLWSSFSAPGCYAQAAAYSEGGVLGPWHHAPRPIFDADGGHGMVFESFDGRLYLVLHRPNTAEKERPCLLPIQLTAEGFCLDKPHG